MADPPRPPAIVQIRGKKLVDMSREELIETVRFLAAVLQEKHLVEPSTREDPAPEPPVRGPRQSSLF